MTHKLEMSVKYEKTDLKKLFPDYYKAKYLPHEVNFPEHNCLAITGIGSPDSKKFVTSLNAIFPVAYAVKHFCKTESIDFTMPKLEAFWWVEPGMVFDQSTKNDWQWQLMIRMPEYVTIDMVDQAVEWVIQDKNILLANEVLLKSVHEGRTVQMMHLGSYYEEENTIAQIMNYVKENELSISGYHHEIYISDPRKTLEAKLKTIIRYSVK